MKQMSVALKPRSIVAVARFKLALAGRQGLLMRRMAACQPQIVSPKLNIVTDIAWG
jgi:hypothetical protein